MCCEASHRTASRRIALFVISILEDQRKYFSFTLMTARTLTYLYQAQQRRIRARLKNLDESNLTPATCGLQEIVARSSISKNLNRISRILQLYVCCYPLIYQIQTKKLFLSLLPVMLPWTTKRRFLRALINLGEYDKFRYLWFLYIMLGSICQSLISFFLFFLQITQSYPRVFLLRYEN